MTLRQIIVATLATGPSYGLEILERVRKHPQLRWRHRVVLFFTIYPILRSMEDDGLLDSYEDPAGAPMRGWLPRRMYKLPGSARPS